MQRKKKTITRSVSEGQETTTRETLTLDLNELLQNNRIVFSPLSTQKRKSEPTIDIYTFRRIIQILDEDDKK